jgi:Skp family chaperone for outer membrane proteins
MNQTIRVAGVLALGFWAAEAAAVAKDQDSGVQQVLRKAQGVVRQLTQEKAALEAEKAQWLQEKAALETRIKGLEAATEKLPSVQADAERHKGEAEKLRGDMDAQAARYRDREQTLLQKHREVIAKAKDIRADNELLVNAVQEREQWIGECGERNRKLTEVNRDVVKRYQDKTVWESLSELEPFTGLAGVKAEAAAEEYRYQIKHLKTRTFEPQAPAPSPADGPTSATEGEDEDDQ